MSVLGKDNTHYKSPRVGICVAYLTTGQEASMAYTKRVRTVVDEAEKII